MGRGIQHQLLNWNRRDFPAVDITDNILDCSGCHSQLEGDQVSGCPLHGCISDSGRADDWCFLGAGCGAVLHFLGRNADSDVSDHRNLGWIEPNLCNNQILSVYIAGFVAHAGGIPVPLQR